MKENNLIQVSKIEHLLNDIDIYKSSSEKLSQSFVIEKEELKTSIFKLEKEIHDKNNIIEGFHTKVCIYFNRFILKIWLKSIYK